MIRKEFKFPSSSGLCDIFAQSFTPDGGNVKAVIQISHGMTEHSDRYIPFAEKLCEAGYAVFTNDHLGHGRSVKDDSMLGFFGSEKGYMNIVNDCKKLTEIAKKEYPNVPYFFFGHSMGSFIARCYTKYYGDGIDAAVYCGTSGPNPGASVGIAMAKLISKTKGEMHRSKFINSVAFGTYNKKTGKKTDCDWLTKDEAIVNEYIADKYCGFIFTAAGFKDLFSVLNEVNANDWYLSFDKKLPVLLIAGEDDPVGAYGKGVTAVYNNLLKTGHEDVSLKLYPTDRHEILNETDREDVMKYLIEWFDSKLK